MTEKADKKVKIVLSRILEEHCLGADNVLVVRISIYDYEVLDKNITLIFDNLKQKDLLADLILPINENLELEKTLVKYGRKGQIITLHPVMLPVVDKFRTLNWQKIKREVEESGILAMFPRLELQN